MERALVIGSTGMDGSHLVDILLNYGYEVHATYRRTSVDNTQRIKHALDEIQMHKMDLTDSSSINRVLQLVMPDVIFNVADQDNIDWSYKLPKLSVDVTYGGVVRLIEGIQTYCPTAFLYQPVSITIFGNSPPKQNEDSNVEPLSPYACAKAAVYHYCNYMRQCYGANILTGILCNHHSERRGEGYLLSKIVNDAFRLLQSPNREKEPLKYFDIEQRVDIGYAPEFMDVVSKMATVRATGNYIIGTGYGHSIEEMLDHTFREVIPGYSWSKNLIEASSPRPSNSPTYIADNTRLKGYTGNAYCFSESLQVINLLISQKCKELGL